MREQQEEPPVAGPEPGIQKFVTAQGTEGSAYFVNDFEGIEVKSCC